MVFINRTSSKLLCIINNDVCLINIKAILITNIKNGKIYV